MSKDSRDVTTEVSKSKKGTKRAVVDENDNQQRNDFP